MVRHLEGEFAIVLVDFRSRRVLLSPDVFSTKPFYYAAWAHQPTGQQRFVTASYQSVLLGLGAPKPTVQRVVANEALVLDLDRPLEPPVQRITLMQWDLRQHKDHTRDWQAAFARAVAVRTERLKHKVFIGLSSGYDTGAIMLALKLQQQPFMAFAIRANEPMEVVFARAAFCKGVGETTIVPINRSRINKETVRLKNVGEPIKFRLSDGTIIKNSDRGAVGASAIYNYARPKGGLVFMTGNGADEIMSDYAMNGKKLFKHSCFRGIFPANLSENRFFPTSAADTKATYCSFYGSSNIAYLMSTEMAGGAHGIEARYPFLDPRVVQEFLWLSQTVKNSEYKRPVADFLRAVSFPNAWGEKHGFTTRADAKPKYGNATHVGNVSAPCCRSTLIPATSSKQQSCEEQSRKGNCRKPDKPHRDRCKVACGRCKVCRDHPSFSEYAHFYRVTKRSRRT